MRSTIETPYENQNFLHRITKKTILSKENNPLKTLQFLRRRLNINLSYPNVVFGLLRTKIRKTYKKGRLFHELSLCEGKTHFKQLILIISKK